MRLVFNKNKYVFECTYKNKDIAKGAGFYWNPKEKCWYTKKIEIASLLKKYADSEVIEKIKEKEKPKMKKSLIGIPSPRDMKYKNYQREGVLFSYYKNNVLIADEMGLGKTIQAIGIMNLKKPVKTLIVCPATLKLNWQIELKKWLCEQKTIEIWTSKKKNAADIVIINYDILDKCKTELNVMKFEMIIADEVHYCKNKKAKRSKAFYDIADLIAQKVYLSGTPIENRPSELFHIIKSLDFDMSWLYYMKRYCAAKKTKYGWDTSGAANLGELQRKLRETIMIRRMKKEVLSELPDKTIQIITIPRNGNENYLNNEILQLNEIVSEYQSGVENLTQTKLGAWSELSKIRHETALKKVPFALDFIKNTLENVDKVIVFAWHTDIIEAIEKNFSEISVKIVGSTEQNKRQQNVEKFQKDKKIKIFLGNIHAAGTGITLTAASTVIFIEIDWTPSKMNQAIDRAHRIGQKNNVNAYYLVFDKSIDSRIAKKLVSKQKVFDQALTKDEYIVDKGGEKENSSKINFTDI